MPFSFSEIKLYCPHSLAHSITYLGSPVFRGIIDYQGRWGTLDALCLFKAAEICFYLGMEDLIYYSIRDHTRSTSLMLLDFHWTIFCIAVIKIRYQLKSDCSSSSTPELWQISVPARALTHNWSPFTNYY